MALKIQEEVALLYHLSVSPCDLLRSLVQSREHFLTHVHASHCSCRFAGWKVWFWLAWGQFYMLKVNGEEDGANATFKNICITWLED